MNTILKHICLFNYNTSRSDGLVASRSHIEAVSFSDSGEFKFVTIGVVSSESGAYDRKSSHDM